MCPTKGLPAEYPETAKKRKERLAAEWEAEKVINTQMTSNIFLYNCVHLMNGQMRLRERGDYDKVCHPSDQRIGRLLDF